MKKTPLARVSKNKVKKDNTKLPKPLIWTTKKADAEFSKWIRARDKKCARCGTEKNLTCSHFWARQHSKTRYDPDNCIALCWMPCHKYHWEKEKQGAYRDFMLQWLGQEKYSDLHAKAHQTYPRADAIRDCMKLLKLTN